jgi:hypothetical protein
MPVGWAVAVVILWMAVVALAAVVLGLLRQITPRLEQAAAQQSAGAVPEGPAVGSTLPAFVAEDGNGDLVTAAQLLRQPTVLLLLSAGCTPCVDLASELSRLDPGEMASSLVVMIDPESTRSLGLPAWAAAVAMPVSEVAHVLGVQTRPFAIAVDADGVVVATQMLNTVAQLTGLAAAIQAPATHQTVLR